MTTKSSSSFALIQADSYLSGYSGGDFYQIPEKRLLFAICERAIRDYLSTNPIEREEAEEWLFDDEMEAPFSFKWICDWLEIDHLRLSGNIKRLSLKSNGREGASREIYDIIRECTFASS